MIEIGLQTFTIRKAQKKDIKEAYLPLIKLGIRSFEVSRMDLTEANALALRELREQYGAEIVSLQIKPKKVFGHFREVVDFAHKVGCKSVVISQLPFSCVLGREEKFFDFISTLDAWYDKYEKEGITLAYHHHHWEYVTLSSGKTRMAELLSRTEKIKLVHDTYWSAKCGIDPVLQMREIGERLLGVHLRDLTLRKRGLDVVSVNCPIGEGVIDFSRVLDEIASLRTPYAVIEQKSADPYSDIKKSLSHLKALTEQR